MRRSHRHLSPLTARELAEIHAQYPHPAVTRLLWEIRRLREKIVLIDQVRQTLGSRVGAANTAGGVWQLFEQELDAEPCLTDPPPPPRHHD